jgi:ribonuclease BN (tRNA processing enzyme)
MHRAGSAYLVRTDRGAMMVDCGPGSVRRLLEAGVSPTEITDLFLTHLHYDHCVDYAYLALSRWDQGVGRIPDLNVVGPRPLRRMTERLLGPDGAFGPDLDARTHHPGSEFIYEMRGGVLPRKPPAPSVREVSHDDTVEGDGWTLRVAEVRHCQPQLVCLAYRLDIEGKSLVFGGDTAPVDALTRLADNADVLVHMCHMINGVVTDPRITDCCSGHLDAARTAADAGVRTLVLTHITEQLEQPGIRERILLEAGKVFGGQIVFAQDLLAVPLDEIVPSRIR